MNDRIEWIRQNTPLLTAISEEFKASQPFKGKTIGTGIHLEPKTVQLILTLQEGGARLVSTGNLGSTQQVCIDYLQAHGVTVVGEPTRDLGQHRRNLQKVLAEKPDIILDNGGDLFDLFRANRYDHLMGGTEETTSGRMRLEPLRAELDMPILVINDSPIKQYAENEHAVGQGVLESYMRMSNRTTNGQCVTVFGYGACGRGVALNFKGAHAKVSVYDPDPLKRLQAHFDGYDTPSREAAIASADFIITVTGASNVITADDVRLFKDRVILANAGHFPREILADEIAASRDVVGRQSFDSEDIESFRLADGREFHILAHGHMVNLAGNRPIGGFIELLDLGFSLQARCLEAVALKRVGRDSCVVPVPLDISNRVATAYLDNVYPRR